MFIPTNTLKVFLYVLIFVAFTNRLFAQEWFEHAKWVFNEQVMLVDYDAHGTQEYTVIKDTLIANETAKLIQRQVTSYQGTTLNIDTLYVYEKNEKVYYWDGTSFVLMYDFSKNVGDTLDINVDLGVCDSVSPVILDSLTLINLDGIELKKQYCSYTEYKTSAGFENELITFEVTELIGNEQNFIYQPQCGAGEHFVYTGLRCFENDNVQYVNDWWATHYPNIACDSLINVSLNTVNMLNSDVSIYPNPTRETIYVSSKNFETNIYKLEVYDLYGKKLLEGSRNTSNINISKLRAGIYLLKIYTDKTNFWVKKIYKQPNNE